MRIIAAVVVAALNAVLIGCAGNGDGLDESGRPIEGDTGELRADFQSIQDNVLTPICTVCHAGAAAPLGLRLEDGLAFAMLVDAPSAQVPELVRVAPGNPDASYLIHKLEGTAAVGERMPLDGPPLSQSDIDVIRQWIIDGAQPAGTQRLPDEPVALQAVVTKPGMRLSRPVLEILVIADGELDASSLHVESVRLTYAGPDAHFGSDDDRAMRDLQLTVRHLAPTSIVITVPDRSLVAGWYRLAISGMGPLPVADRNGTSIDGDVDGTAGGDFLHDFELESVR